MTVRPQRFVLIAAAAMALAGAGSAALADTPAAKPDAAAPGPIQLPPPVPGKGQVVFYRKPLFSLIPFNWVAREGTTEICEMVAGTYCVADVDPGTHTYEVHSEVKNDLTLEVDAGETYYVIGGISMGLIVNHPNISPAQKAQFDAISFKLKSQAPIAATSTTTAATTAAPAPAPAASTAPAATAPSAVAPASAAPAATPAAAAAPAK